MNMFYFWFYEIYKAEFSQGVNHIEILDQLKEVHKHKMNNEIDTIKCNENNEFLVLAIQIKEKCDFYTFTKLVYNYIKEYNRLIKPTDIFSIFSYKNCNHDLEYLCPITYFKIFIDFYNNNTWEYTHANYFFKRTKISDFKCCIFTPKISYNEFDIAYITNCITSEMDIEYYFSVYLKRIEKAFDFSKKYLIINLNFYNAENKKKWDEYENIKEIFHKDIIKSVMSDFCLTVFQSRLYSFEYNIYYFIRMFNLKYKEADENVKENTEMVPVIIKEHDFGQNYQAESLNFTFAINTKPTTIKNTTDFNGIKFFQKFKHVNISISTPVFEIEYKYIFHKYEENVDDIIFIDALECRIYTKTKTYGKNGSEVSKIAQIYYSNVIKDNLSILNNFFLQNEFLKLSFEIKKFVYTKFYFL
ncbi:hypothetical protein GVAV_001788 [Gurleya vavrai]